MGQQLNPRSAVSVDTSHLGPAASRYDAKSNSINALLGNTFTQVAEDLQTACGNDESGQKIYASIADIQKDMVKDTRLLVEVLSLTGDGIRDMRDAYEQAETNAQLLARGSDPTQHIGTNPPNPGSDNTSSPNTDTSSGSNGRNKH